MKKLVLILVYFYFRKFNDWRNFSKQGGENLIMNKTGNSFVEIEISIEALDSHLDHGDTIINRGGESGCEPSAC